MRRRAAEEQAEALIQRWLRVAPNWHEVAPPEAWDRSSAISKSSLALLHEHLRRLGLLSLRWEALQEWQFADQALCSVVNAVDEDAQLPREWWQRLEASHLHWIAQLSAGNHLLWKLYVSETDGPPGGVPDPYEPWLRLFERGAYLFEHHGRFHVSDDCSIAPLPLPEYASLAPLRDLSNPALDDLDINQGTGQLCVERA